MGLNASKEGQDARAREIATIKAVGAAANAGAESPGRPVPKSTIQNPLMPSGSMQQVPGTPPRGGATVATASSAPANEADASISAPGSGPAGPGHVHTASGTSEGSMMTPLGDTPSAAGGEGAAEHHNSGDAAATADLRARSAKLTPADFVLLKTIGQGSFGLVLQVMCGVVRIDRALFR